MYDITRNLLASLICLFLLSACGGGGGKKDPANVPPTVSLASSSAAEAMSPFSVTATSEDSDGRVASFLWEQETGESVTLASVDTASLSFTAPAVSIDTELVFKLTVTDNLGLTASTNITVTITPQNAPPVISLDTTATVASNTSFSTTATVSDSDGTIASYSWEQLSGTTTTLESTNTSQLAFTAPTVNTDTALTFRLTVTDDDGASTAANITVTVTAIVSAGNITGKIINYNDGSAIAGATVTSGGQSGVTDSDGNYTLSNVGYSDRAIVNAEHNSFAKQSKIVSVSSTQDNVQLTLKMLPVDYEETFSPTSDRLIDDPASEASVAITANSLVDSNGDLPTGDVTAKLTVLDPSQVTDVMPGDFLTDDNASGLRQIESFGAATITFEDQNNNELNLSNGASSTVRIPVNTKNSTPKATIPLYYYDDSTGEWVQEGTASLVGSGDTAYYEGTVTHFSTWNCDDIYDRVLINGCVVDIDNNPISGITATSEGSNYSGSATTITDSNGLFSIYAKQNAQVILFASDSGRKSNTVTVSTGTDDVDLTPCLIMGDQNISVTLTWGDSPRDLDSHLVGPDYHVYYSSRGSLSSAPYANLDVDDTTGQGPEVVSITRFSEPGVYTYSVRNYSGTFTPDMTGSPAKVELNLNGQVYLYTPPAGEESNRVWNVFTLTVDSSNNVSVQTLGTWSSSVATN